MNEKTFYAFYEEKINQIINDLQNRCKEGNFWSESIWESIAEGIAADLYEVFHRAAVRCLIVELHVCKNAGMLSGKTSGEEYDSYCSILAGREYVDIVYQKYPGLVQYMAELEKIQTAFWIEFLQRLAEDWNQIKAYFQLDTKSRILSVRRNGSDFHCKGKSVVVVETDWKKKILYKPHSLTNEIFLQNMAAEIYKEAGLTEFRYLELEKDGYGWVEEVTWEECGSEEEVSAFYRRTGILAAIAYVLGTGDLHYENIIAHGEFPVIIDAETLFQHREPLYQWREKTTGFYSVLSSGLFPGGTADRNTAGMTGGNQCISSKKIPVIVHDKTSEMCIDYQKIQMPGGKNQARYQKEAVSWGDYEKEIVQGFEIAYQWFCENREEVLRTVLSFKDKLKSRYVSGATHFFGLCLLTSVHPELMGSKDGRLHYLQNLCKDRRFGNQEMEAMLCGDIPYFFQEMTDRNLYDENGIVQEDFQEVTIEEQLKNRIWELSQEDCELQKKTIALSCQLFGKSHENRKSGQEEAVSDSQAAFYDVEWAKEIAEYILDNAVRERDKIYWLGIEEENETVKIRPVDVYFYNGIAGIAVFFRKLHQVCGLHSEVCKKLEKMLFSYTDRVCQGEISPVTEYPGMYCGEGSVVYAYQILYRITGQIKYRDYADRHAKILIGCVRPDAPFDLTYGNAGAVLALCQQYTDTGDEFYLAQAHRALDYLDCQCIKSEQGITWFEKPEGNPVCSMAHGNSGVMLAYARMQSLDDKADYLEQIKEIIRYEDRFYDSEKGNWADLRKYGEDRWKMYAWCNGGVGVVMARTQAMLWKVMDGQSFFDMDEMRQVMKKLPMQNDMCLCHGNLGNYFALRMFLGIDRDKTLKAKLQNYEETMVRNLKSRLPKGKEGMYYGMMVGIAGIGIGVLCCLDNEF